MESPPSAVSPPLRCGKVGVADSGGTLPYPSSAPFSPPPVCTTASPPFPSAAALAFHVNLTTYIFLYFLIFRVS